MFTQPTSVVLAEPVVWLGDCHPLVEQLGSAGAALGWTDPAPRPRGGFIRDLPGLRRALRAYQQEVLLPVELPAILRAWQHATRNQLRELLALDRRLAEEAALRPFAESSRLVGQRQLRRFAPLRDVRFVQRYLRALDAGRAQAWHTLVYGVTLWLFALPLRQGLNGYARQVTRGFIRAAGGPLRLESAARQALFAEAMAPLHAPIEALVAGTGPSGPLR